MSDPMDIFGYFGYLFGKHSSHTLVPDSRDSSYLLAGVFPLFIYTLILK
jgi:hypothetical protein